MANILGNYNPIMYANEALIQLEKALGMAARVHRGFEGERASFRLGDTINIRRPSVFTADDAPASTKQDLNTDVIPLILDQWKEVRFVLTDQELAYTTERIIEDHIRPAAYALADNIDTALAALTLQTGHIDITAASGSLGVSDILDARKVMFDNAVPLQDVGNIHYMIGGAAEAEFLALTAFSQFQGAGDTGVSTQLRGTLGTKFGIEIFANQNALAAFTAGTASVTALLTNGVFARGVTVIQLDAATVTGTIVPGDVFTIASDSQKYVATNTVTAATNAFANVEFLPALKIAVGDGVAVTLGTQNDSANGEGLMFHRNAIALALAPLPETGGRLGAQIATATDPVTGLSLRSRLWYDGENSAVNIGLDVLYGIKTLDPNLMVRSQIP